ncbi:TOBE domain-containing protein [Utexia brackfieldae]|uniref:TOBE domain-containing protein n=1 Tax=Utexia brackfieldae TaxID=3074108 RepID=UPI00370D87FD
MLEAEILLTLKLKQQLFTDTRRIALLKQIKITGSLSQAAKMVGISYKTAWDAVHQMNTLSPKLMVEASIGGKGGGGAKLSRYAQRFIQLYDLLTTLEYRAFKTLNDDDAPLDNLLAATAKLSVQTSARNQLYGTIIQLPDAALSGAVKVLLEDGRTRLTVNMTQGSIKRLDLAENKAVILLIKAPNVTISKQVQTDSDNQFTATISNVMSDALWHEIELQLPSGLIICATLSAAQFLRQLYEKGDIVSVSVNPENIILATLV